MLKLLSPCSQYSQLSRNIRSSGTEDAGICRNGDVPQCCLCQIPCASTQVQPSCIVRQLNVPSDYERIHTIHPGTKCKEACSEALERQYSS